MRSMPWITATCSLLTLAALGCAGGSPSEPPATQAAPVSKSRPVADPNTGLVAEFVATLDPAAGTIAIEPVTREGSAIGDTFSEVGLTPAFTGRFGRHFWAEAVRWNGTDVEVDFATRHPFQPDKRPDLGIFNMKLWVGSELTGATVAGIHGVPDLVTNADGHSDMWNLTAEQGIPGGAPYQPYVIIHEDPTSLPFDFHAPAGWNVLFPGQSSIDTVALDLSTVPAGPLTLHLYLTADYGQSATRPTRQNPQYELPKFAGNTPWKVTVTELGNGLEEGNTGSNANFQLDIWDWKHGQSLGSDVTGAQVFVPDFVVSPLTPTLSGTGTDPTPLTGSFLVPNTLNASAGDYWGVVAVNDAASGVGLKDDLVTPVSVTYTTYQWFPLSVTGVSTTPPTAAITRCKSNPLNTGIEDTFDGSGSTPGTNPISTYEWDFDYQVGSFTTMSSGITGSYAWPAVGTYEVALRVSDGGSGTDIETMSVTVGGAPAWSAPLRLTNNAVQEIYGAPIDSAHGSIAVGPDGVAHMLYSVVLFAAPFNATTYHTEFGGCAGTTWSTPEVVYATPAANQVSRVATIAIDSANTLHVSIARTTIGPYIYTAKSAGVWSAPVDIMAPPPGDGSRWVFGNLATSGANELGFLALQSRPSGCSGSTSLPAVPYELWFMKKTGATWSAPLMVGTADLTVSTSCPGPGSTGSVYGFNPNLSGTNSGEFVAVWDSLFTPFNGTNPQVSDSPTKIKWNRTTSGTWAGQADLYTNATSFRSPRLARSPDGTIWLLSRLGNGGDLGLAKYNGTTWDAALTNVMSMPTGSFPTFTIAFDADGRGILANSQQVFGSNPTVKRFVQTDTTAGVAGMTATPLEASLSLHRFPIVAAPLGDGRHVAAWTTAKYGVNPFHSSGDEIDTVVFQ